jgi:hypothetical protein
VVRPNAAGSQLKLHRALPTVADSWVVSLLQPQ